MQALIYNMEGMQVGTTDLPDSVFGLPWNGALVKQVVEAERAHARAGTAHTKDRGAVSGGGKKPWRQKGTGRARHGSIRSPLWVGGGVTHGPKNTKDFTKTTTRNMRRAALLVSLSGKARDGEIVVFDSFLIPDAKTKSAAGVFRKLTAAGVEHIGERAGAALVVLPQYDGEIIRSLRNLPHVESTEARMLTARSVLSAKYVVFPQESIREVERTAVKRK